MDNNDSSIRSVVKHFRKCRNVKLVGKCNQCGRCCDCFTQTFIIDYKNHLIPFVGYSNHNCPYWDKEKRICTSRDKRPMMCKVYPYLPEHVSHEGCGWKFKNIKQRKRVECYETNKKKENTTEK